MHRLMIADSDDVFLSVASQIFSAEFEVITCQDGETALEMLAEYKPQALVINLFLPFKDGLTVLQEAEVLPPVIIATTSIILPHIEKACLNLPIGYLMVAPCMNALRVRLITMVALWENNNKPLDLCAQTVNHLHIMNFPTHRTGYKQLCQALPMYFRDRDQCLDTVLYAELARMFNKSSGQAVERAIRKVIQDAWVKREKTVWRKYFPKHTECPSNRVFFDILADHLFE